jgi:hypothetical protein
LIFLLSFDIIKSAGVERDLRHTGCITENYRRFEGQ